LNLPAAELRTRHDTDGFKVYDPLRRKYVALTPEEYVRQNFTHWLSHFLHYPESVMANEVSLTLNGMHRRCDTVVFMPDGSPMMIVEYKAPKVAVSQKVFDQIARYNMVLRASCLVVSNGMEHFCCLVDNDSRTYRFIPSVPDYFQLKQHLSI